MNKIYVIKIGGNVIDNEEKLTAFISNLSIANKPFILVHGGGKLATDLAEKLSIPQQMVDGRRITDAQTLKIAVMTYAGYINKNIVAMCQKNNINSMGFSGADGNLIQANKRPAEPIDFGFVGDISKNSVNVSFLKKILQLELTPVICAITHNNEGQLLNTNADAIANAIATSLAPFYEVELVYCFEKKGVLLNPDDEDSYIKNLCLKEFHDLKNKNIINKGMIPKLENCFDALQNGVSEIGIINASNIANYLNKNNNEGTRIR